MCVVRDISLRLKTRDVLRREGFSGYSKVRSDIRSLIRELLANAETSHLLQPVIAYQIYPVAGVSQQQLPHETALAGLGCSLPPSFMPNAKELVVAVCAIGRKPQKQVAHYTTRREPLRSLLLDGIGSAAVDLLVEEVCKLMASEASPRGYEASSPVSPGMPGLPLTEQWQLLNLVPAQEIRVSVTSAGVLIPRKSVSLPIGPGPRMRKWTRADASARCHLNRTCPYRIHSAKS